MRIRTLIPINAKPGVSLIQVTNPKNGRATRILVPRNAIPGKMVELELPDDGAVSKSKGRASPNSEFGNKDLDVRSPMSSKPSSRIGTPPRIYGAAAPTQLNLQDNRTAYESSSSASSGSQEGEPLLKKNLSPKSQNSGCCSCFSNLCGLLS